MKFAVAKEHRDFFRKHFRIEFNNLLSSEQCNQLISERLVVLSERLKVSKANFKTASINDQFIAGFDLWRGNNVLKKFILQKNLAQVVAELLEIQSLRIGYDQSLPVLPPFPQPEDTYQKWLSQNISLDEMSSIQGIVAGLIICIKAPVESELTESSKLPVETTPMNDETPAAVNIPSLFSTTLGNGVCFSSDTPLDFSDLTARRGYSYLLIAYAKGTSVYCKKDSDPHTNNFRQYGYNFGDRLSDRYHPLIVF